MLKIMTMRYSPSADQREGKRGCGCHLHGDGGPLVAIKPDLICNAQHSVKVTCCHGSPAFMIVVPVIYERFAVLFPTAMIYDLVQPR